MRIVSAALALASLLLPAAAEAASPVTPVVGLRVAFAPAMGDVTPDLSLSSVAAWQLPIQLDAGVRFGRITAGAYGAWALAGVGNASCGAGSSCSASALRLGAQGAYSFHPLQGLAGVAPWAGVALGWERLSHARERLGSRLERTYSGFEGSIQGGGEWAVAGRFAVGPFLQLSIGRYGSMSLDTPEASASADLTSRATHLWLQLGVRGTLSL
jgi:hypothetical protein